VSRHAPVKAVSRHAPVKERLRTRHGFQRYVYSSCQLLCHC